MAHQNEVKKPARPASLARDIRKRVVMNSASAWDIDYLTMFNVTFAEDTYDPLPMKVSEVASLPMLPCEQKGLYLFKFSLIVGLDRLMNDCDVLDSNDLNDSDAQDSKISKTGALRSTMLKIKDMLVPLGQEAVARIAKENRNARERREKRKVENLTPVESDPTASSASIAAPILPRKRKHSDSSESDSSESDAASFGQDSAHTTPTKSVKPEKETQVLMEIFFCDVILALYGTRTISLEWVEGRQMKAAFQQ